MEINSSPLSIEGKHLPIEEQLMKFTKAILDKNYNEGCYDTQLSPQHPMSLNPLSARSLLSETVPTSQSPNKPTSAHRILEIEIVGSPKPA